MSDGSERAAPDLEDRIPTDQLIPLIYSELRRIAAARLHGDRAGASLTPTMLVHEAYLRLAGSAAAEARVWNDVAHFRGAAAIAMRRILIERARRNARRTPALAGRHDNDDFGAIEAPREITHLGGRAIDLIELDHALDALSGHDARKYQVVMLRFFAGSSVEETAAALGISEPTVKRDWNFARAWLLDRIEHRGTT